MYQAEDYYAARQHIGARLRQEDYFAFAAKDEGPDKEPGVLMVVADGMGGHQAGSFASRLASNSFVDAFLKSETDDMEERLFTALSNANDAVLRGTEASLERVGCMGTTLVGVTVDSTGLRWVSVGDSPAFLFRNGQIRRLNEDHSFRPMIEEQIERGIITRQQAREHPNRNTLRSAVTGYPIDLIDLSTEPLPLKEDDIVVAASDGLFSLSNAGFKEELIACRECSASEIAETLLDATLSTRSDYQDNITVGVIKAKPWVSGVGRGQKVGLGNGA